MMTIDELMSLLASRLRASEALLQGVRAERDEARAAFDESDAENVTLARERDEARTVAREMLREWVGDGCHTERPSEYHTYLTQFSWLKEEA